MNSEVCSAWGVWLFERIGVPLVENGNGTLSADVRYHDVVRSVVSIRSATPELLACFPAEKAPKRLKELRGQDIFAISHSIWIPTALGWAVFAIMMGLREAASTKEKKAVRRVRALLVEAAMGSAEDTTEGYT